MLYIYYFLGDCNYSWREIMKFMRIKALVSYTILLSLTALMFGCKPIFEKKPLPSKESQEQTAAPVTAPPPAASEPLETEEIQTIQSVPATTEPLDLADTDTEAASEDLSSSIAPEQEIDDGDEVVKTTPAIMKKVQQALVDAGFNPGPVDGVSGAKTVAAIENFQKKNDIPAGKINKRTLRALGVDF